MKEEEVEKIMKEELDYKDENLNQIYRITEEDSYEDYEPETELHKDLVALRLAQNDPEKFEMYFKNANINDVKNEAYNLTTKEKLDMLLMQGEIFNCDYDFEKRIINNYLSTIKKCGFINDIDSLKMYFMNKNELIKLIENEANSIMTTNAVIADLKERYNLNFKLFIESGLDKQGYINKKIKIDEFLNYINNENSINLGGYADFFNKMLINTTLHNKAFIDDPIYNQQSLLKTLYHETRHAMMFKKIKNKEIGKQEYLIAKNLEYIIKFPKNYRNCHDFFEAEIDATDFAEKEVRKDYKNSNINIITEPDITQNRNTKIYSLINDLTMFSPDRYINKLAQYETMKLSRLIKMLYLDDTMPYDLKQYLVFMNIKNHKFINTDGMSNIELRYLKGFLECIKKEELDKIFQIANGPVKNFKKDGMYYLKEYAKIYKAADKIK